MAAASASSNQVPNLRHVTTLLSSRLDSSSQRLILCHAFVQIELNGVFRKHSVAASSNWECWSNKKKNLEKVCKKKKKNAVATGMQ